MKDKGLNIEDEDNPADYVGVNIKKLHDSTYEFTQHALIDSIIDGIDTRIFYTKPVSMKVSLQLHAFKDSPKFDKKFNYPSAIGKLNYLRTMRPDIVCAVHQGAKYSSYPRKEHIKAIIYNVKCLKATRHRPSLQANVILTLQVNQINNSLLQTLVPPSLEVVGSYSMQIVLSFGSPNFSLK